MALLGFHSSTAVRRHIEDLLKSLTELDFAEQAVMRPKDGGVLYGDVYGKRDEFGVWFIKFSFSGGTTTVIMSCHEAELPLKLADGRTLRPIRST